MNNDPPHSSKSTEIRIFPEMSPLNHLEERIQQPNGNSKKTIPSGPLINA